MNKKLKNPREKRKDIIEIKNCFGIVKISRIKTIYSSLLLINELQKSHLSKLLSLDKWLFL